MGRVGSSLVPGSTSNPAAVGKIIYSDEQVSGVAKRFPGLGSGGSLETGTRERPLPLVCCYLGSGHKVAAEDHCGGHLFRP